MVAKALSHLLVAWDAPKLDTTLTWILRSEEIEYHPARAVAKPIQAGFFLFQQWCAITLTKLRHFAYFTTAQTNGLGEASLKEKYKKRRNRNDFVLSRALDISRSRK